MTLTETGRRKLVQHHGRICRRVLDNYAPCFESFSYVARSVPAFHDSVVLTVRFKGEVHICKGTYNDCITFIHQLLDLEEVESNPFDQIVEFCDSVLCQVTS